METQTETTEFQTINSGFNAVFKQNKLSVGLVVPIEAYPNSPIPTMERHVQRVQLAEELGFTSVWLRDVPFNVPSFGDAGQTFDPFVYLGLLAGQTKSIALGVASIILPLRHPVHVAKAAASADVLSGGRVILGVASGDRPQEYPAMNFPFEERSYRFQDSFEYMRRLDEDFPSFENSFGSPYGIMDMLPKATGGKIPLMVTGSSRQDPNWIAQNSDGWIIYPRNASAQAGIIKDFQARVSAANRPPQPVMQPLYIDLVDDDDARPQPIHLGFRSGKNAVIGYLKELESAGINHVALNLRFNEADTETTMKQLAEKVLPEFI